MKDLNSIHLTGRLVEEITVKQTTSGKTVGNFTLASNRKVGDSEETIYIDCTVWEKQAEVLVNYTKKGDRLLIIGRLSQEKWEKDGVKNSKIKITVEDFSLLTPKADKVTTQVKQENKNNPPF